LADVDRESPDVSVVVPVYDNGDTVFPLHEKIRQVLRRENLTHEIIFVNDACPFGSLAVLQRLAATDGHVKVTALERNVGQHRAVLLGLERARGRSAVIMDGDLQDPPEAIPTLLGELKKGRAAVFAGRCGRYEPGGRLLTSRAFKTLLHKLSGVPPDAGMYVAVNRATIDHLVSRREKHPFVVAMIGTSGLPCASIPVQRARRPSGRSRYNSWMRIRAAFHAVRIALRPRAQRVR
jgi:polyisoprenyl-phosphate glycosyltransferase